MTITITGVVNVEDLSGMLGKYEGSSRYSNFEKSTIVKPLPSTSAPPIVIDPFTLE
jgi:hypothetical protein